MDRDEFVNVGLESLLRDKTISKALDKAKTPKERQIIEDGLRISLIDTYDNKGLKTYYTANSRSVAEGLRNVGATADTLSYAGTILGGYGLGPFLAGIGTKTSADLLDNNNYETNLRDLKGRFSIKGIKLASEMLLSRLYSAIPGLGYLDRYRGQRKFDEAANELGIKHAKKEFLEMYKAGNRIPLNYFKNSTLPIKYYDDNSREAA